VATYHGPINPDTFYHIYSRANGQEKLFIIEDNYRFFLEKYKLHIHPVATTYAWCLLPNHFHFLVRSRTFEEIQLHYTMVKDRSELIPDLLPGFMMERFSNWLNSYTKAFNKVNERKGSLFVDYMRREPVLLHEQLEDTVAYIHRNPVHHGFVRRIEDWKWSSYRSFFSHGETSLERMAVLDWFHGIIGFERYHQQPVYLKNAVIPGA
jgi:putative transposase